MASPNFEERLATLLDVPVDVIRAYGKPLTFKVARKVVGKVVEVEPSAARLATIKAEAGPPPAQEVAPPTTDENEIYAQWRDASDAEKPELEKKLFNAVLKHARAVIWQKLHESDPGLEDLARDIASDAIKNLSLGRFDERSKFSTYVQGIAKNKINEELETRMIRRERFYVSGDNPEEDINLRDAKAEVAFGNVVQAVDLERLDRWAKELQPKDYCVWECLRDGMTMKATAEKLGISEDSAENSLRRKVRPHLRKKYLREPDGKDLLSATNSTRGEF